MYPSLFAFPRDNLILAEIYDLQCCRSVYSSLSTGLMETVREMCVKCMIHTLAYPSMV